mmetsp:Transcript_9137/g.27014  ORF Transcript_9137/g.27014 Transcript_9137/m.27014 type:complete len:200 (+) Transcript_9137:1813-2412(+)
MESDDWSVLDFASFRTESTLASTSFRCFTISSAASLAHFSACNPRSAFTAVSCLSNCSQRAASSSASATRTSLSTFCSCVVRASWDFAIFSSSGGNMGAICFCKASTRASVKAFESAATRSTACCDVEALLDTLSATCRTSWRSWPEVASIAGWIFASTLAIELCNSVLIWAASAAVHIGVFGMAARLPRPMTQKGHAH